MYFTFKPILILFKEIFICYIRAFGFHTIFLLLCLSTTFLFLHDKRTLSLHSTPLLWKLRSYGFVVVVVDPDLYLAKDCHSSWFSKDLLGMLLKWHYSCYSNIVLRNVIGVTFSAKYKFGAFRLRRPACRGCISNLLYSFFDIFVVFLPNFGALEMQFFSENFQTNNYRSCCAT